MLKLLIQPLHTNSKIVGVGKRGAKAALVRNYLEVYWPCAGGLWAVNAIGAQLRDPKYTGLTRWGMAVS